MARAIVWHMEQDKKREQKHGSQQKTCVDDDFRQYECNIDAAKSDQLKN